jgi:hypothetical protein
LKLHDLSPEFKKEYDSKEFGILIEEEEEEEEEKKESENE